MQYFILVCLVLFLGSQPVYSPYTAHASLWFSLDKVIGTAFFFQTCLGVTCFLRVLLILHRILIVAT